MNEKGFRSRQLHLSFSVIGATEIVLLFTLNENFIGCTCTRLVSNSEA